MSKAVSNWMAWEGKNGARRVYVTKDKFFFEGEGGLCQQDGTFTSDDIADVYRFTGERPFDEIFSLIKAANERKAKNKKEVSRLKKEMKTKIESAETLEEKNKIRFEYMPLIRAAEYAD